MKTKRRRRRRRRLDLLLLLLHPIMNPPHERSFFSMARMGVGRYSCRIEGREEFANFAAFCDFFKGESP